MAELGAKASKLISREGYLAGLQFKPQPTDVIIAPFAKCGTTWLQQMVHSLRTGGDLDFDDISRVVPWIETAADLGLDLDAPQRASPRAFKSHLAWDDVPKGGRYIVSTRDPCDALVSAYHFFEGWFFEPGTIDVESLGRPRFVEGRDYYRHLASWLDQRDNPDVLLLAYEHMKNDLEGTVRRVASFVGIDASDEVVATACEQSSLRSMKANDHLYDDLMMRQRSEVVCDLPAGSDSRKVRDGKVGSHKAVLSPAFIAELADVWREMITPRFGFDDYSALLTMLS